MSLKSLEGACGAAASLAGLIVTVALALTQPMQRPRP